MILKDNETTMLFVDIAMFYNPDYINTLLNVFKNEYENGNHDIDVVIKSTDNVVKLNIRGQEHIDPTALEKFLMLIQEKYTSELNTGREEHSDVEAEKKLEKEIDIQIVKNLVESKIDKLEMI